MFYNLKNKIIEDKMKPYSFQISIISAIILKVLSFNAVQPNWLSSPYFRANNQKVISKLTGNNQTPQYTFTFSSPLPGIPNLAYGIKGYQGNDFLSQQYFQIRRIDLTASTFRVSVQIFGSTNIKILNVPYIAIDATFPHHLNSFDNVPLNYSSGQLTNISVQSSNVQSFTQNINYTNQAAGKIYTRFQFPLQGNKIALFITSLFISGKFGTTKKYYPVQITLTASILNQSFYQCKATAYQQLKITKIHFSQIIFNSQDIKNSKLYLLEYYIWETDANGGFYAFPNQFTDNFIMGLMDFKTIDGRCGIQYIWDFKYQNITHGVKLFPSIITYGTCGLSLMRSTILYIKTWECPTANNFFNLPVQLCHDECPDYFYKNYQQTQCTPCYYSCQGCTNRGQMQCSNCNADKDHRQLIDGTCLCVKGYFDDGINPECVNCMAVLPNCLDCDNNPSFFGLNSTDINVKQHACKQCLKSFFHNRTSFECQPFVTCSASKNQFLNTALNKCERCSLFGCIRCESLDSCEICDTDNRYLAISQLNGTETTIVIKCLYQCGQDKEKFNEIQGKCIARSQNAMIASKAISMFLSIPSVRVALQFAFSMFIFVQDIWFYKYHDKEYSPFIQTIIQEVQNINEQKIFPFKLNFFAIQEKINKNKQFFDQKYKQYTKIAISRKGMTSTAFLANALPIIVYGVVSLSSLASVLLILSLCFSIINIQGQNMIKVRQKIKENVGLVIFVGAFFETNLIGISFFAFQQLTTPFAFGFVQKLNFCASICFLFMFLIYSLCFFVLTYQFALKQRAENLLKYTTFKIASFFQATYMLSCKQIFRAFVHAYLVGNNILQISLLTLSCLLQVVCVIYFRKCFQSCFYFVFYLGYSISFFVLNLKFLLFQAIDLSQIPALSLLVQYGQLTEMIIVGTMCLMLALLLTCSLVIPIYKLCKQKLCLKHEEFQLGFQKEPANIIQQDADYFPNEADQGASKTKDKNRMHQGIGRFCDSKTGIKLYVESKKKSQKEIQLAQEMNSHLQAVNYIRQLNHTENLIFREEIKGIKKKKIKESPTLKLKKFKSQKNTISYDSLIITKLVDK